MTNGDWRPIAPEESDVVRAVLAASGLANVQSLLEELHGALVTNETTWILDMKVTTSGAGVHVPDGPFPVRAFVSDDGNYRGEIIVWMTDGHVSGLEYAWVSDETPTRWPRQDEMEIVPPSSSQ